MNSVLGCFTAVVLIASSYAVNADWRGGKVSQINVGYDGKTITFKVAGWSRSNCTCYPTWPDTMCLDTARTTYEFEKAMLLSSRARGTELNAHIEEASCKVVALYEVN